MNSEKYLNSLGFDEPSLPVLFNSDDKSYYTVAELMESYLYYQNNPPWKDNVSHSTSLVLNYLKKHKCTIEFYWWCGIQQYKVVVNGKRKNYPRINEENWSEVKQYLTKVEGDYQTSEIFELT